MSELVVREATEADIPAISEIFHAVYGDDYPYQGFYDVTWMKRSIFSDSILMLVAEDSDDQQVLGTASVVFDVGAHSDLMAEFGRLAVHPDARGRGVGNRLMVGRCNFVQNRLHCAIVENRCVHPFSQKISLAHGFSACGFLPMKHLFNTRESIALYCRHYGPGLSLRKNHPRIVPEAHPIAHQALEACGLPVDVIVDEEAPPYPYDEDYEIELLTADHLPSLMRIERGRIRNREIFGPMRLQYGFFKLTARHATYLIARRKGTIVGAIGFIQDDLEKALRVFELITNTDNVVRSLLGAMVDHAEAAGIEYIEADVNAHSPRMQRTLLEFGFVVAGFVPAMAFHLVERLDVVKMVKLLVPPDLGDVVLIPASQRIADLVMRQINTRAVLPRIANAIGEMHLFDGLTEEQATRVAGTCSVSEFAPGDELFAQGSDPTQMFILLDGTVGVERDGKPVGVVNLGEPVGESALLMDEPHSAQAIARSPVSAAVLSSADLDDLTRQRPDISVVLYRNLAVALGRKLRLA